MPIELMTGLPGTSKTTRLVARMIEESEKKNPRPLVAFGVNGLKPGLATILDDPRKWAEITDRTQGPCTCPLIGGDIDSDTGKYPPHTHRIPMGAIVFIDEAWKWFGHLHDAARQATPKHVLDLAEHRHMGIDFVWTTQAPAQIYPFARSQIATHTHIVRKFGTQICDTYTWGELNEDVKSEGKRAVALRGTSAMPTHAWEWFQSAQEHTIKRNIPWRVVAIPGFAIAAVLFAWLAYTKLRPEAMAPSLAGERPDAALAAPAAASTEGTASRASIDKPLTPEEYTAAHLPRFATMPHTAPIFDGRAPMSDPLLFCMSSKPGMDAAENFSAELTCTCLTEQGTKYDLPDGHCMRVARWGQPYNPYRERHDVAGGQSPGREQATGQGREPTTPLNVQATTAGPGAKPAAYGEMRAATWVTDQHRISVNLSPAATLALKLYALAAMVIDHADWLLLGGALGFHDTMGRAVFPLFAFLLAWNCARAWSAFHLLRSVAPRMALFGVLAIPFYVPLAGGYPLNVMFTLAASVAIVALLRMEHRILASVLFLLAGAVVDYQWFGIACVVLGWWGISRGILGGWELSLLFAALLWPINGNAWALLLLPLLLASTLIQGNAPRLKWLFYTVYPVHLAALWLLGV